MDSHDHHDEVNPQTGCCESPEAHQAGVSSRRTFLRRTLLGALTLMAGGPLLEAIVPGTVPGLSAIFANTPGLERLPTDPPIKSVIVLWMDGGPSQIDTFDPKPGHANGGPHKAIKTAIPGAMISEHLGRTAEIFDRFSLIRCMSTREGNHARAKELMRTGFTPNPTVAYPGLGSIMGLELGDYDAPLPPNVVINSPSQGGGALGISVDPFLVSDPRRQVENLAPAAGITAERLDRRARILKAQDDRFAQKLGGRSFEAEGHQAMVQSAMRFMNAPEAKAFDVSQESESIRAKYGDSKFGQGCLMARRLVESGVRFVEVTLGGWDTHEDNFTRTANLMTDLDKGMSALVKELEERGLLKTTLVMCLGEFGRTPKINENEGRDHFPGAWSVALAGAGIRSGAVLGETSADGMEIRGSKVECADLFRSILWATGIDPDTEYYTSKGRPVKYADGGRLITGLLKPMA